MNYLLLSLILGASVLTTQVPYQGPPLQTTTNTVFVPIDRHAQTNTVVQSSSSSKVDPFSDPLIQQIQVRQEKAVNGDTKETKALTADLEKWTQEQPANYLLMAYLGSVYTLDSRDAWPGPGKLTYLRNGGKLMDAAVAAAPDNPAVRFVRAIDYYELPFFFGKGKTARDDFPNSAQASRRRSGKRPTCSTSKPSRRSITMRASVSSSSRNCPRPRTPGNAD